jgi:hypothetical protein
MTAPTPVATLQPMIAAWVNGRSSRPDRLLGRADDKLGKRPDPRHLVDWLAVKLHARRAVVHHPARRIVVADAQDGAAG